MDSERHAEKSINPCTKLVGLSAVIPHLVQYVDLLDYRCLDRIRDWKVQNLELERHIVI